MRNRLLSRTALGVATIAIAASASAGVAMAATQAPRTSSKPVLKLANVSVTSGGKTVKSSILVNSAGDTVYLLTGDTTKKPKCATQSCLGDWPAVTSAGKIVLGTGIKGKVAIWHHNGLSQLTIAGHPLYTFAGDGGPGVAHGQGLASFGGTWLVVGASGASASLSSTSKSSGSDSGSGSGSGW